VVTDVERRAARPWLGLVLAGVVAAGSALLVAPAVLRGLSRPPNDAIGYAGVAHNWLSGRGFVDPILWAWDLDVRAPVPALTTRPPVPSLLAALPLALGADWTGLCLAHVGWASALGAAALLAARRWLSLPAALAFAVLIAWSPAWGQVARAPMSEVSSVAVLLFVLFRAPDVVIRHRDAVALALATWIGWLARPNLVVVAPALLLAVALDRGVRGCLRCGPLRTYLGATAGLLLGFSWLARTLNGHAPYALYAGVMRRVQMSEMFEYFGEDDSLFRVEIAAGVAHNVGLAADQLFGPFFLRVGWLVLAGCIYGLVGGARPALALRIAAVLGLALLVSALAFIPGFDPRRYLIPGVVCLALPGIALLSDAADSAAERLSGGSGGARGPLRSAARWLPLVVVGGLFVGSGGLHHVLRSVQHGIAVVREGTTPHAPSRFERAARQLCPAVDRDALVSSPDPWAFYFWCGNAGYHTPVDLSTERRLRVFLEERTVGYVVATPEHVVIARSPRLEQIAEADGWALYRVRNAPPASRPWRAPPPLASLRRRESP
jgi:hypothetical protein